MIKQIWVILIAGTLVWGQYDSMVQEWLNRAAQILDEDLENSLSAQHQLRLRYTSVDHDSAPKLYLRLTQEHGWYQWGMRLGQESAEDPVRLEALYGYFMLNEFRAGIGNIRLQQGLSQLWADPYGGAPGSFAPWASTRVRQKVGPHLSGSATDHLRGFVLTREMGVYSMGLIFVRPLKSSSAVSLWQPLKSRSGDAWKLPSPRVSALYWAVVHDRVQMTLNLVAGNTGDPLSQGASELIWDTQFELFQCSGSLAKQPHAHAMTAQVFNRDNTLSWLIRGYYISPQWQPVLGQLSTGSGTAGNEKGLYWALETDIFKTNMSAGMVLFQAIQGIPGLLKERGTSSWLELQWKTGNWGEFDVRWREQCKMVDQERSWQELTTQHFSDWDRAETRIRWIFPRPWSGRFECTLVNLRPLIEDNQKGILLSLWLTHIEWKKWKSQINLRWGHTEGWDSRIYAYIPGVTGEFNIRPYYQGVASLSGKAAYRITDESSVSFRWTYQPENLTNTRGYWQFGLQLDHRVN